MDSKQRGRTGEETGMQRWTGRGGVERGLKKRELGQCLSGQTGEAAAGGAHHL